MSYIKNPYQFNKVYLIQTDNSQLRLLQEGLKENTTIKSITTYTVKDNDITFININLSQTMIYTEFEEISKNINNILKQDTKIYYKDNTRTICFQYTPMSLMNKKKETNMDLIQDDCDDKD